MREALDLVKAVKTLEAAEVLTATQLVLPANLPFEQYERLGVNIRRLREASKWWLGDWIIYGESTYGDKYAQAVEATDYSLGYLRNIVSTCRRVTPSRRRDDLEFSHHTEVAKLKPNDQRRWLAIAVRENLSQSVLRERIRDEEATLSTSPGVDEGADRPLVQQPLDREQAVGEDGGSPRATESSSSLPTLYAIPGSLCRQLVTDAVAGRDGYMRVPRHLIERLATIID